MWYLLAPGRGVGLRPGWSGWWVGRSVCFLLLLVAMTGCQLSQSAFSRSAGDAGAAFSASATTLTYLHAGKITYAYAHASFAGYESELSDLEQQLPIQDGRPDQHTVQQLLTLATPAVRAVEQPCLTSSCDWRGQLVVLKRASVAFLKAGGQ